MPRNEFFESAGFPVEIGQDDIEWVSGGYAGMDYVEPVAIFIPPTIPPPPPK